MLCIDVRARSNNLKEVSFYNSWDLPEDAIIITDWNELNKYTKKGSFLKFDDGSEFFTEIVKVNRTTVITTAGRYKIADLIHCSRPKDNDATYNGVLTKEESFFVKPLRDKEKSDILSFFKGELKSFRSPRVNKVIQEIMQQALAETGFDATESVQLLVEEVRSEKRGQHWGYAHKACNIIMGFDTSKLQDEKDRDPSYLGGGDVLDFLDSVDDAEVVLEEKLSKEKNIPDGRAMRSLNNAVAKVAPENVNEILDMF